MQRNDVAIASTVVTYQDVLAHFGGFTKLPQYLRDAMDKGQKIYKNPNGTFYTVGTSITWDFSKQAKPPIVQGKTTAGAAIGVTPEGEQWFYDYYQQQQQKDFPWWILAVIGGIGALLLLLKR